MEKKMMKQMMMALLLAMMPFAASAQETPVVQEQADSLLSPSIMVNRHFYVKDLPLDVSKVKYMSAIKYGENGNLMVFTMYPNFTIPKEWEKYEIPRSRVKSLSEIEDRIETYQQMLSLTRHNENADALSGKPLLLPIRSYMERTPFQVMKYEKTSCLRTISSQKQYLKKKYMPDSIESRTRTGIW